MGVDCDPTDIKVFPAAESQCDGQYNDCELWTDAYRYKYDDCFCETDLCGGICLTDAGNECTATQYN